MFELFRVLFKYKEKESPDQIGFFPEKVHVEAFPERRYLWTSRLLVVLSVLSICFNMMLASTIYILLPQISVHPRFFRINDYFHQVEVVQKDEVPYWGSDLITEKYIDEYINLRYTITGNLREMSNRWKSGSAFYWYSSPSIYNDFVENDMVAFVNLAKKNRIQRYVKVEWIRPLSMGLWQTQFKMYDILPTSKEPKVTYWRATMNIFYARLSFIDKNKRLLNPYGFLINDFALSYHGSDDANESYIETARRRSRGG